MAVDRALWWSVWWPWAVVWVVTALALLVALGAVVAAWRGRARYAPAPGVPGVPIYLDEKAVMDLYQVGGYGDAMTKEVVDRVGTTRDGKIALKGVDVGVEGARQSGREVVKTYIENSEPIAVVGVLLGALESAHGVVHVDLRDRTVRGDVALERALGDGARTARLRRIDAYVSVRGEFRETGRHDGTRVFQAPYGDPDDPAEGPQVVVECQSAGLRPDVVPEGVFSARCLGRVQAWKAGSGEMVIRPIAVFL
ncbi:hypothetical protein [Actinosynnema sp.]|uniref:hypothetical protein n=1 Tax=Actinosynnema sp. TaxID=1872144 RepID=UPI003F86A85D